MQKVGAHRCDAYSGFTTQWTRMQRALQAGYSALTGGQRCGVRSGLGRIPLHGHHVGHHVGHHCMYTKQSSHGCHKCGPPNIPCLWQKG
eukprot:142691-Pelagomonas_calceolata.AAC.3